MTYVTMTYLKYLMTYHHDISYVMVICHDKISWLEVLDFICHDNMIDMSWWYVMVICHDEKYFRSPWHIFMTYNICHEDMSWEFMGIYMSLTMSWWWYVLTICHEDMSWGFMGIYMSLTMSLGYVMMKHHGDISWQGLKCHEDMSWGHVMTICHERILDVMSICHEQPSWWYIMVGSYMSWGMSWRYVMVNMSWRYVMTINLGRLNNNMSWRYVIKICHEILSWWYIMVDIYVMTIYHEEVSSGNIMVIYHGRSIYVMVIYHEYMWGRNIIVISK